MDNKGDIPSRESIEPPGKLSGNARAKVETVEEIIDSGGSVHAYLVSVPGDDEHLYEYNTHLFPEKGWIFFHGDDRDKWIPGNDIGMLERHYE